VKRRQKRMRSLLLLVRGKPGVRLKKTMIYQFSLFVELEL
jgi:hypothetical protein